MDDLIKRAREAAYAATNGLFLDELADALESQQTELTRLRSLVSGEDAQMQLIAQEREALRADAERYQFIKSRTRVFSLDMGGSHAYVMDFAIARLRGSSLDAAIDAALSAASEGKS